MVINVFFIASRAQNVDSLSTPKIGLVLSGGGAKGLAHIGVLKIFEEVGLKPDYITGTSIGSIIGGLYALGYSAEELSEMNANADWGILLSDKIELNKIVMEEKYESNRYLFNFPIRDFKFKLPSGLIEGQQLNSFFNQLVWPLPRQESFDSLPIPFHCMAVDLIKGETVELKSGDFVESIRSSMSIPSVFAPEHIDSMLLVDGGMTKNFPVKEVQKMGADYVIGVYVGFKEDVTSDDFFSLTRVLSRATSLSGINDARDEMKHVDLLIVPDLGDYGAADFSKAIKIEKKGEVAAEKFRQQLKELAEKQKNKKKITKIELPEKIRINDIKVENQKFIQKDFVIGQSGLEKGQYVSNMDMYKAIENIYGTFYFKKVTYSLVKNNDDSYDVILKLKEKSQALFNVAPTYDSNLGVGLTTNLTLRNYLVPSSRAVVSFKIAENPIARILLNKYIGSRQKFIAYSLLNWSLNQLPYFVDGSDFGTYDRTFFNLGLGLKQSLTLNQQIGANLTFEYNTFSPHENLRRYFQKEKFKFYKTEGSALKLYYRLNSTDNIYFPEKGMKLDLEYKFNFNMQPVISNGNEELDKEIFPDALNNFGSLFVDFDWYVKPFDFMTLNLGASAILSSDNRSSPNMPLIGGTYHGSDENHIPFIGLSYAEILSRNFIMSRVVADFRLIDKFYFSVEGNFGFESKSSSEIYEHLVTDLFSPSIQGFGAGIKINSVIGPVRVMATRNNTSNKWHWYVSLGFPF
ncbi:MAG: patatin-like phospholipase family protein [Bacteroidales bacterium]|nr:patatin-like phospholipase family protein [Bacteroidales bacterium]